MIEKKITKEEVKHIAKLARISLSDKEIEKFQKELCKILDYFEILKDAPYLKEENIPQTRMELREDKEEVSFLSSEIIKSAPDYQNSYIKVKAIF